MALIGITSKILVVALALSGASTAAFASCKSDSSARKLSGAALTSHMKKCERDATTVCAADSASKRLAGAAKNSHMKKCVSDAVGA